MSCTRARSKPAPSNQVTRKKGKKKKKAEPRVQQRVFANCAKCGVNLSRWGLGKTNGATCPPCERSLYDLDRSVRANRIRATGRKDALLVNVDGTTEVVDMTGTTPNGVFGQITCIVYRKPEVFMEKNLGTPYFDAHIGDTSLVDGSQYNAAASKILANTGMFNLRDDDVCGRVLITQAHGTLLPSEIKRLRAAK